MLEFSFVISLFVLEHIMQSNWHTKYKLGT